MTLDHHPAPIELRSEAHEALRASMRARLAQLIAEPASKPLRGIELAQLTECLGIDVPTALAGRGSRIPTARTEGHQ
ncbi:MAG TPA: hypothetical protein PKC43_06600 [Phycisphaerales bacterium]|nr:hypothetical protein [Phycisphaerales bacterium]HMP37101.1 hypothetical protein [Phycisphaerales bacterium]